MGLTTLYVDFNSYFASAEQQLTPRLRGRPIVVAPVTSDSGCCIAVSVQAKKVGIKTGMRVFEARRLCPEVEVVDSRPGEYVKMHHRLLEAIETCLPIEAVCSIDEVSCKLGAGQREEAQATALAQRVKAAVRQRVGEVMTCSIGLAPNRFLAKIATDMHKPDGLVVIREAELPRCLFGLELRDLPGVGPNMEKRLRAGGVNSVEELCARSENQMEQLWESVVGRRWYRWLRGEDFDEGPPKKRSIGHQHVLAPEKRDEAQARAIAQRLLLKAAARMRSLGYWAGRVTVGVSLEPVGWSRGRGAAAAGNGGGGGGGGGGGEKGGGEGKFNVGTFIRDGGRHAETAKTENAPPVSGGVSIGWGGARRESWHATAPLPHGCQDSLRLLEEFARLWSQRPAGRVRLVDVTFSELIKESDVTPPLFEAERKRVQLSKAMDEINSRYGRHAVYTGGVHEVRDQARGGIAFRSIPDLDFSDSVE
jgi:DNA polymerase-4